MDGQRKDDPGSTSSPTGEKLSSELQELLLKIERSFPHGDDIANAYLQYAIKAVELAVSGAGKDVLKSMPKSRAELRAATPKGSETAPPSSTANLGNRILIPIIAKRANCLVDEFTSLQRRRDALMKLSNIGKV
jgi:hypothetical protein